MDYFDFDKLSVETQETSLDGRDVTSETDVLFGGKVEKVGEYNKIEKYYPKLTGNTISRFEFCHVITQLAKYLESLADLSKYLDLKEKENEEISFINPAEQAFNLLMNHKFDAILQRRNEKVSFSVLEIDPQDIDIIKWDFEQQHEVQKELMKRWRFEYK